MNWKQKAPKKGMGARWTLKWKKTGIDSTKRRVGTGGAGSLALCCALSLLALLVLGRPNPLRLHVLANSDSPEDQAVKLEVRDAILEAAADVAPATGVQDAERLVMERGAQLQAAVERVLRERGFSYGVQLYLGKSDFPDKTYGGVTYPAGEYEALRVVLGEGKGQNWWCVIYPPLCLADETEAEEVEFGSLLGEFFRWLFGG